MSYWQLADEDGWGNKTFHSPTQSISVFRDFKDVSDNWVVKVVMH